MENSILPNGDSKVNGTKSATAPRPRTPSFNALSLTEYATNASPPSGDPRSKIRGVIPEEFLLPNGYPDVRYPLHPLANLQKLIGFSIAVSTPNPHLSGLRGRQRNPPHRSHKPEQQIRMQRPPETRRSPAGIQLQAAGRI